jgi:hypothetical protein
MTRSAIDQDDRPCTLVMPAPGIGVDHTAWTCEATGATASAPPSFLSLRSTDAEVDRVRGAVHRGVAAVQQVRRRPRVLEKYRVDVLPGRWGRDLRIFARVVADSIGFLLVIPLVVAGVMQVLGFEALAHAFFILFGVLLSIPVHELGHVIAFRALAPSGSPVRVWWSGMNAGLVRRPLSPRRDVAVTLAGPSSPLLLVLVLWPLMGIAELIAFSIVGIGHALSLFLPGGDRDALRAARDDCR